MTNRDPRGARATAVRPAGTSAGSGVALWAGLLVAVTLVAYLPALRNGFIFDDNEYVTDNLPLRTLTGLARIWFELGATPHQYYPLTFSSFWVEYHLWGPQPFGYHLVNVLLHGLNAVLLWRVFHHLRLPGAWVAAAIFALHPIQVESVAWITERKNLLSGFFALSACLVYLRDPSLRDAGSRTRRTDLAVMALGIAAMLAKTVTCTLPAVLLVLGWWQGRLNRRTVRVVVVLGVASAAVAALTVWMERHHVGAEGQQWALSLVERGLIAGRALWFYPYTLVWPYPLTFMYPRWVINVRRWWQYGFPIAALAVLGGLWLARPRLGSGPFVAVLCYAVLLAPVLGFFDIYFMRYAFVADHFAYLPSIPLIALAVPAAGSLFDRRGETGLLTARASAAGILLVFAALTAWQCGVYRDLRTLWRDTLAKNPSCWAAHNNLGIVYANDGNLEAAVDEYEAALELRPRHAEAHNNLAVAIAQEGRTQEAIAHFEQALRIKPSYPEAHNNLGNALQMQGHLDDAIAHYAQAVQQQPSYADAQNNLGSALLAQGKPIEAIPHLEEAVRLRPELALAHSNLGAAFARQGNAARARAELQTALRLDPNDGEARQQLAQLQQSQPDAPE